MNRLKQNLMVSLGTVSHGTLREEDLIPAFLEVLECNTGARGRVAFHKILRNNTDVLDRDGDLVTEDEYKSEDQSYQDALGWLLNEDIIPALDELAPPYCYFGAHEGDGSDFGFWVSEEALDEAVKDGEVWRDPDDGMGGHPRSCPRTAAYRLVVSDHGNMTLYYRNGREVWGVV